MKQIFETIMQLLTSVQALKYIDLDGDSCLPAGGDLLNSTVIPSLRGICSAVRTLFRRFFPRLSRGQNSDVNLDTFFPSPFQGEGYRVRMHAAVFNYPSLS